MVLEDKDTQSQDEEIQLLDFIPQQPKERSLMVRGKTYTQDMMLML